MLRRGGVDVVFDPVGGVQLREAINCAKPPTWAGTRILLLGFAGGKGEIANCEALVARL